MNLLSSRLRHSLSCIGALNLKTYFKDLMVHFKQQFLTMQFAYHLKGNRILLLTRHLCTCSTGFCITSRQLLARDHFLECTRAHHSSYISESYHTGPRIWERGSEHGFFPSWLGGFLKLGFRRSSLGSGLRLTALILAREAKEHPDCLNLPSSASFWTSLHWSWKCRET